MEKCPNCNGEDVQRVSVVYKTGVTTRFLKKKLAPPEPNANEGRYTVIICGIFLSLYFIRKGLVGETTNAYLSVGAWAVNVIIPIALWLIFYPKIKKDRDAIKKKYLEEFRQWQCKWICMKCGEVFSGVEKSEIEFTTLEDPFRTSPKWKRIIIVGFEIILFLIIAYFLWQAFIAK